MKKILSVLVALAMLVVALAACAAPAAAPTEAPAVTDAAATAQPAQTEPVNADAPKKLTVAFCQTGVSNAWRLAETNSIKDEAAKRGYELIYTDANEDTAKQVADVEDVIAKKPDVIMLAPREFEGLAPALAAAKAANIPVILLDRDCKGEAGVDYVSLICADFVWEGKTAAEALVKKLGTDKPMNVVQITGTPDASSTIDRQKGFEEELAKYPNFKIVATQNGEYIRAVAQKAMENIIQSQGDTINAVYGHDDECAIGAMQALKAAGYKPGENVQIVGVGGFKDAAVAIQAKEMLGTVLCSPFFGPTAFDTAEKVVAGEKVPTFIQNPGYLIDESNVAEYLPKAF